MKLQCCNSTKSKLSAPLKQKQKQRFNKFGGNHKNVWRRPVKDYGLSNKKKERRLLSELFILACEQLSDDLGLPRSTVRKKMTDGLAKQAIPATWKKFFEQEEHCYAFNQLLSYSDIASDRYGEYLVFPRLCNDIERLLSLAVEEINNILTLDWSVANRIYIGPGAAITNLSTTSDPLEKFDQQCWSYPNRSYNPEEFFDSETAQYIAHKHSGVSADKILQVPKNCDVNRTIGVGTVVGIASQHVCGNYIRRCMQRHGIDLTLLAEEHREYAWLGSLENRYQTIDFSMASDSLSLGLVSRLLGGKHSSYRARTLLKKLLNCRATHFKIGDLTHSYYKISAMGNASTFELESLIFTAIGRALTKIHYLDYYKLYDLSRFRPRAATSFGDDLILDLLPFDGVDQWICAQLAQLGLQVNKEKSFFTGNFRESCGGDYLDGRNVRGLYLHHTVIRIPDVIRTFNFFHVCHEVPLKDLLAIPAFKRAYDYYQLKFLHSGEMGSINPFKPVLYDNTLMMDDLDGRRSLGYIIRILSGTADKECVKTDDVFMFLESGQYNPDFTPRFRPRVPGDYDCVSVNMADSNSSLLDLVLPQPLVRIKEPTSGTKYKRAVFSANGKDARILG
jgi:hypothetical protein